LLQLNLPKTLFELPCVLIILKFKDHKKKIQIIKKLTILILNRIIHFLIFFALNYSLPTSIQATNLKYEFRGTWIATVKNIDWPSKPGLPVENQKSEIKSLFISLHNSGINAVFFHVRTECDAFYPSDIEPWSFWLTGEQAKPPQPFYDPLKYAIKLARERGMEFHAWFNPFRVKADTKGYNPDSSYISYQKPEWIIQSGKYKFLNPGIREAREYVKNVVLDVLQRYDVDGIHFDDYFYPYSGLTDEDIEVFKIYNRKFENIEDWRRDNVNVFVRDIYESIKKIKPYVKFGISPFGIWKDGVPEGITGLSAFHKIYCDAVYWLNEKIVDYLVPQVYWRIEGPQDYISLSNWWSEQSNNRNIYIGHALYKMDRKEDVWNLKNITDQVHFNQSNSDLKGSVFFRAKDIQKNLKGIADSLQYKYYNTPTIIPPMTWIDSIAPLLFPFNLKALPSANGSFLIWENPFFAIPENEIKYNAVYRFKNDSGVEILNGKNILDILPSSQSFFVDTTGNPGTEYTYTVTAMDRLYNESEISNVAKIKFSQLEIIRKKTTENKLYNLDSSSARINFSITKKEIVNLSLFNQNGEIISNLLNEELQAGTYSVLLKSNLNSGKYFYKLTTQSFSDMKSFIIK